MKEIIGIKSQEYINNEESHLDTELSAIEEMEHYEDKKSHFLSINVKNPYPLRNTKTFIRYLKMFPSYTDNVNILKDLLSLCLYTDEEIKNHDLIKIIRLSNRTRRVSWDANLVEVKEIEGREIKKRKLLETKEPNKIILYEYDIQKIQDCDRERVLEIINELRKF
ncbi:hypothetical protein P3W45_001081 [Vairimorpha bombi]|jgi:hypothetical protein